MVPLSSRLLPEKTFGEQFRALRKEAKKTIPQVAKALGLSAGHLSNMETGKSAPFTAEQWHKAAIFLNVDTKMREILWSKAAAEHAVLHAADTLATTLKSKYKDMPVHIRRALRIIIEADHKEPV